MDLEASVDVRAMATAALRQLTTADVNLLKTILVAGLYPQVLDMGPTLICPIPVALGALYRADVGFF